MALYLKIFKKFMGLQFKLTNFVDKKYSVKLKSLMFVNILMHYLDHNFEFL